MKRYLVISLALFLAVAVAVPAMALEVKYGGLFRARVLSQDNFTTSPTLLSYPELTANYTNHYNRFDQRLRMFFDFIASENLKVVTKLEANTVWGSYGNPAQRNIVGGGNVGADVNNLGVKNAYVDFKIPTMPYLKYTVGVQGINLLDSWIVDDDFSAAMVTADLKPFQISLGYVSGQNFSATREDENIDDLAVAVSYAEGPFKAGIIGFYQYAHNTPASVTPWTMDTPVQMDVQSSPTGWANPFFGPLSPFATLVAERNNLFDLGVTLGYKIDYLSAYLNFVKNFGSVKIGPTPATLQSADYTGWMIDAGVNYFCAPFTANLGGFYTTGADFKQDPVTKQIYIDSKDLEYFTYPLATSKYFSEIMGGGILDNTAPNGGYWRGYPFPFNIWTVTVGGSYQILPETKLSASYWYFGTSREVPGKFDNFGNASFSSDLGHEFDFYLTQRLVDKLNLDLVAAYMLTGDAFRAKFANNPVGDDSGNVYELGARLQWAF